MEPTGIDLPETYSQNLEFKKGYTVGYYTAAFGQGIWMTTVQLVRAYSALANNGALVQPSMVQEGRTNIDLEKQRQVVSPETAQTLAKMLVSVVDNGFGKPAKILGYSICGKTGTAEMSWSTLGINKRGYSDATTQSFIGWFPADNPKFLILVKMINPQAKTAEYSVIPVFHDLAQYAAYLYQVPPDRPVNVSVPAATVPSATVPSATVSTTPPAVLPGQSNLTP
jgi:cell division protein FtsI/penicillin-binding protein 2